MATNCIYAVGKNIENDCNISPIVAGFKSVGILINRQDVADYLRDANDFRKIDGFEFKEGKKPYLINVPVTDPYNGTVEAENVDGLMPKFNKTVSIVIPMGGTDTSKNVIEPILKNRDGFIVVLERNWNGENVSDTDINNGRYVVYGSELGLKGATTGRTIADVATDGSWQVTLVETGASFAEVNLAAQGSSTPQSIFELLLSQAQGTTPAPTE